MGRLIILESKYGSLEYAQQKIHHYENENGSIIDENTYNDVNVQGTTHSLYDYEHNLNEAKREIKLIDSVYKPILISELKKLFK